MASPADIITYIGVPLAVLGVSPILYNFVVAFLVKWSLRRKVAAAGLQGDVEARSRLMSGFVDLELPIYQVSLVEKSQLAGKTDTRSSVATTIKGGSWVPLTFGPSLPQRQKFAGTRLKRLPEAEVSFHDLLRYFRLFGYQLEREGFSILRQQQQIPPHTKLIRMDSLMSGNETYLCTVRSSLDYLNSLTLKFENLGSWLPHHEEVDRLGEFQGNATGKVPFQQIKDKVIQERLLSDPDVPGTNQYFLPTPSQESRVDIVTTEDGLHFKDFGTVHATVSTEENRSPATKLVSEQSNRLPEQNIGRFEDPGASETSVEPALRRSQKGISNEEVGNASIPGQVIAEDGGSAVTSSAAHVEPPLADDSDIGLHLWMGVSGLYQARLINSNSENNGTKIGDFIKIVETLQGNSLFQHALSGTMDLHKPVRFPVFKYKPNFVYGVVFAPIQLCRLLLMIRNLITLSLERQHSQPKAAGRYLKHLSSYRERELERLLTPELSYRQRSRGVNVISLYDSYTQHGAALWDECKYEFVSLPELQSLIDVSAWKEVDHPDWISMSRTQLPTAETTIYYILTVNYFGRRMIRCLHFF